MVSTPFQDEQGQHQLNVQLKVLDDDIAVPYYALPGDAGADLSTTIDVVLGAGERLLVPTGVAIAIPQGFAGFIHPRSGLDVRSGLSVVNAPGTIDAGYRGEIKAPMINPDPTVTSHLQRGERIAQSVIRPDVQAHVTVVTGLPESVRLDAGLWATGGLIRSQ